MLEWAKKQPGIRKKRAGSLRNAAEILGRDFETVRRWATEKRTPDFAGRKLCRKKCNIREDDWDLPIEAPSRPSEAP